jgi:hypothetical protein
LVESGLLCGLLAARLHTLLGSEVDNQGAFVSDLDPTRHLCACGQPKEEWAHCCWACGRGEEQEQQQEQPEDNSDERDE